MAQGEFSVERQNWARWPRVLTVKRRTDAGTETRRYLPEQSKTAWNERRYALGKIAELEAEQRDWQAIARSHEQTVERMGEENASLRELVRNLIRATHPADRAKLIVNAVELGIEVDG